MTVNPLRFAFAAALAAGSTALAKEADIYDYVVVGSGPGGGSLA